MKLTKNNSSENIVALLKETSIFLLVKRYLEIQEGNDVQFDPLQMFTSTKQPSISVKDVKLDYPDMNDDQCKSICKDFAREGKFLGVYLVDIRWLIFIRSV